MIQIRFAALAEITQLDSSLDRREQVAQQKQQLAAYRLQCLQHYLKQPISAAQIVKNHYGKPQLETMQAAFNHSHSQQHYALAMSETVQDLGIDIEDTQRQVRFDALAKHAFHPHEYAQWQQSQNLTYWFLVWTTKEAILKAHGLGIRLSLNSLDTQVDLKQMRGQAIHPQLGCFDYQHFINDDFISTVAWASRVDVPTLQVI